MAKTCPYCSLHLLRTSYPLPLINCFTLPNTKEVLGGPLMNLNGECSGCVRKRSVLKKTQAPIIAIKRIKGLMGGIFPDINAGIVSVNQLRASCHTKYGEVGFLYGNNHSYGASRLAKNQNLWFSPETWVLALSHLKPMSISVHVIMLLL
jgi:hypothetical protein